MPVLLRINATFGIDVQLFSGDEEMRLFTELREALTSISDNIPA